MSFNSRSKKLLFGLVVALIASISSPMVGMTSAVSRVAQQGEVCAGTVLTHFAVKLDGVALDLCTPFAPAQIMSQPTTDSSAQVATVVNQTGKYQELSITAARFGTSPGTEQLPIADVGTEETYRAALKEFRKQQGLIVGNGPVITMLGKQILSTVSIGWLNLRVTTTAPTAIVEWVVETANHVWIIRACQELDEVVGIDQSMQVFIQSLEGITINGTDSASTTAPHTVYLPLINSLDRAAAESRDTIRSIARGTPQVTPRRGECDYDGVYKNAMGVSAFALGGEFMGIKACGPLPGKRDGLEVRWIGAVTVYEWQCVELVMRYLYLQYGISPYSGNGKDIVNNYKGSRFVLVNNGTVGRAPKPGDVISFNPTAEFGHTAIVVDSNVDASGNGSIRTLNQNLTRDGYSTLQVKQWVVQPADGSGPAIGWLHDPASDQICPAPTSISPEDGTTSVARTVNLVWNASSCANGGYTVHITTSPDPESGIIPSGDTGAGQSQFPFTFPSTGTFYWHVAAWSNGQRTAWSSPRKIIIGTSSVSSCSPDVNQVTLYSQTGFGGNCKTLNIGDYGDPGMFAPVGNDDTRSVRVGSNAQLLLYPNANSEGTPTTLTSDVSNLSNNAIGYGTSSARVQPRPTTPICTTNADQVTLYSGTNYSGNCKTLNVGDYGDPGLFAPVGNDDTRSVRIGSNIQLMLYPNATFDGTPTTLTNDDRDLADNPISYGTSSARVQVRPTTTVVNITVPIASDASDGYEDPTFRLSGDGNHNDWVGTSPQVMLGWLFTNVNIPRGARIVQAYVRTRGYGTGGTSTARVVGVAEDNAALFTPTGTNKPSTRPVTSAAVNWANNWAFQWQWFQTPDLSSVVQEVVNRNGWAPGQTLGLRVDNLNGTGANWSVADYAAGPYNNDGGSGHSTILSVAYEVGPGATVATCTTSADQVTLYSETNYTGTCKTLNTGDYGDPGTFAPVGNDDTHSARVGSNVQLLLYPNATFIGTPTILTTDASNLANSLIGYGTSSARVQRKATTPTCTNSGSQVTLYSQPNYMGNCKTLGVGDYGDPGLFAPVGNDDTRSVRVGSNVQILLYPNANIDGTPTVLSGDIPDLVSNSIGYGTSSARVQVRPTTTTTNVTVPISSDAADGYEDPTFRVSGDGNHNDWVGSSSQVMLGWLFTNINIPRGAKIVQAYVRARGFGTGGTSTARVVGFAEDNAALFSPTGSNKPSTRPVTSAAVSWSNNWTFQWQWFQTPDLSSVVQEIVNRNGWAPGQTFGLRVSNANGTGANWSVADYAAGLYNNDGGSGHNVMLYVIYQAP